MNNNNNSRRNFIKKAAIGSLITASIPEIVSAAMVKESTSKISLQKNNIILFQGDSITDAGRNKEDNSFNNARVLGSGYAMLTGAALLEKYASLDLKIYNMGISGNKVYQLAERWDKDCLDIKPDILSILIGVNDIWHKLNGQYEGTVGIYKKDYIALLERTKRTLPNVKLVICEPFAVPGVKAVDDKWYPEFYDYQKAAREIADKFSATFIPYQKIYDEAQKRAPGVYWTHDGVHASLAGAKLMAEAWLSAIK
ncbi:MAG TPA: SGNH/GDSL hydrolase family protein [Bacteroidales bacterium]|nr:SGNH/GDSL hydrolase family protein [Bacteroidales bacterium]